jgi:hypothetical protein
MLVFVELGADIARGCALPVIVHTCPLTHPHPAVRGAGALVRLRTPALVVPALGASDVGGDVLLEHR